MQRRVVVVLDPEYGDKIAELPSTQPAWIVDSPQNAAPWTRANAAKRNTTTFSVTDPDARVNNLVAQLDNIDLHFGIDSYPENPYVGIGVIGLALSDEVEAALRQYGFADFRQTEEGFDADLYLSARLRC